MYSFAEKKGRGCSRSNEVSVGGGVIIGWMFKAGGHQKVMQSDLKTPVPVKVGTFIFKCNVSTVQVSSLTLQGHVLTIFDDHRARESTPVS